MALGSSRAGGSPSLNNQMGRAINQREGSLDLLDISMILGLIALVSSLANLAITQRRYRGRNQERVDDASSRVVSAFILCVSSGVTMLYR